MAFKGLVQRFQEQAAELYRPSAREGGPTGRNDQPFVEIKPTDPNRNETTHDTRMLPIGSTKRDLVRIGKWLNSDQGRVFMLTEGVLQLGNTFSETRIYNPTFVIGNVVPYLHLRRPLAVPSSFAVKGDQTHLSPGSDTQIGAAGRLQINTSKQVISQVVGTSGPGGLLALLPSNVITDAIRGVVELRNVGSLGVDQRPELDINGEYYSVLLWKGFSKRAGVKSNLEAAAQNLRIGNLKGAANALKAGARNVLNNARGVIPEKVLPIDGRDRDDSGMEGRRYFITGAQTADRYIKGSVYDGTDKSGNVVPAVSMPQVKINPAILPKFHIDIPDPFKNLPSIHIGVPDLGIDFPNIGTGDFGKTIGSVAGAVTRFAKAADRDVRQVIKTAKNIRNAIQELSPITIVAANGNDGEAEGAAEKSMLFPNLAMRHRFLNDERVAFIRDQVKEQQASGRAYWQAPARDSLSKSFGNLGIDGGITPGADPNMGANTRSTSRKAYHDRLNDVDVIENAGDATISPQTIEALRQSAGQDLINLFFFDFVNKTMVPFRAYITNITENVAAEWSNQRYIGRTEKAYNYVGAERSLNFQLRIHAFDGNELTRIWNKINYLTSLCYPADYSGGFMVPPLVKLTIGDVYKDQPGYLANVVHNIEENTSWETQPGVQVPHGITTNISFITIEKSQMSAKGLLTGGKANWFYSFGTPRKN
jgi:hypothetical protein